MKSFKRIGRVNMNIIPQPQKITITNNKFSLDIIDKIIVNGNTDNRIIKAVNIMKKDVTNITKRNIKVITNQLSNNGIIIYCNKNVKGYVIKITEEKIEILAQNDNMAFYGIQTIRQIISENNKQIDCCLIEDYPAFPVRGFYFDVSRGRVPTLEYLYKVVDLLSLYKINHLQLYIEDAFDFIEYKDIIDEKTKLTADEILALDDYCYDHYIDLVPSLSTFGHLYCLLQSEKYKDLCELKNFTPKQHYWLEKMEHHTIDIGNEKSFELISSLLDQYIPLFRSNYFNICCDETMDLCTDKNKEKNPATEYYNFVSKIINYISKYNKKVMMWADIALKYSEKITTLPEDVIFLNWTYRAEPREEQIAMLADIKNSQIVCPGTVSWNKFVESIPEAESNIVKLVKYGEKYGAIGVLNTYWGDCGHINAFNGSLYGMALGAQMSWNTSVEINEQFELMASKLLYGYNEINIIDAIKNVSKCEEPFHWWHLLHWYSKTIMQKTDYSFECSIDDVIGNFDIIDSTITKLKTIPANDRIQDILIGCEGIRLITKIFLHIHKSEKYLDAKILKKEVDNWFKAFSDSWLRDNKESQLKYIKDFMYDLIEAQ